MNGPPVSAAAPSPGANGVASPSNTPQASSGRATPSSLRPPSSLLRPATADTRSSSLNPKQSQGRSLDDSETLDTKKNEEEQSYIDVSCGALTGRLYLEKMCKQIGSKGKGLGKCIQYGDKMVTPQDFESLGGKKTSKAWKKSIRHKNKPLLRFFASGVFKESESLSQIEPII